MQGGGSSGSISIRKKSKPSDLLHADTGRPGGTRDALQGLSSATPRPGHHQDVLKERAMEDLKAFFERKGAPRSRAEEFKIHIKHKGTSDGSYSVHYTDRNGEMYLSKGDVFASLDRKIDNIESSESGTSANRAQRKCVREMQRSLDPEWLKQKAKDAKEAEAKEKERLKKLATLEKEKKDREREILKEVKIKEKLQAKEMVRTKSKKEERGKAAIRKDVAADQKRAQIAALGEVLDQFDLEEDMLDLQSALLTPAVVGAAFQGSEKLSVIDILSEPSNRADMGTLSSQEIENILDVTSCLQAYQGFLKLPAHICHFDEFLQCLEDAAAPPPAVQMQEPVNEGNADVLPDVEFLHLQRDPDVTLNGVPASEAMDLIDDNLEEPKAVLESKTLLEPKADATDCNAIDELSPEEKYSKAILAAEAEIDRLQLNLLFPILRELNEFLGLEETVGKDNDNMSRRDKKSTLEHNSLLWSLPLNQLTFPELFRMCIIMRIGQELNQPEIDVEAALKGGQAVQYSTAKNIARAIRYRMIVRNRLCEAFEADPVMEASIICGGDALPIQRGKTSYNEVQDKLFSKAFSLEKMVCTNSPVRAFDGDSEISCDIGSEVNLSFEIGPVDFDFSSENDLIDSVAFAADGKDGILQATFREDAKKRADLYENNGANEAFERPVVLKKNILPGVYRRCCKVWVKLATMSSAKKFMWEVDKEMFPDYYQLLKDPMSLSAVAYRLSQMQYGDPFGENIKSAEEGILLVSRQFYKDVRSVCLNCITYNTENEILTAQAQKMLLTLHQHIVRWVLPPRKLFNNPHANFTRPDIGCCDDAHCLYTGKLIDIPTAQKKIVSIKCGRCFGVFSLDALKRHFDRFGESNSRDSVSASGSPHVGVVIPDREDTYSTGVDTNSNTVAAVSSVVNEKREDHEDLMKFFYVPPTDEVIGQSAEEWVCLLCLRDDCTGISENFSVSYCNTKHEPVASNFGLDEWGPSTKLPWRLNPSVSNFASDADSFIDGRRVIIDGSCGYGVDFPGVKVESFKDNFKFTVEQSHEVSRGLNEIKVADTEYPGGLPPQVLILQSCARVLGDISVSSLLPQFIAAPTNATYLSTLSFGYKSRAYEAKSWSREDRLLTFRGLCELIRNNASAHAYLEKLNNECMKLAKLSTPTGNGTSLPVEAAFVEQCKIVAGDAGLSLFRRMMGGRCATGADDANGDDIYSQNAVIAGRCQVCKGSTFEDDCPNSEDCVLLCDGCNVEAHLHCVALASVPSGDWYCDSCSERIAARDSVGGAALDYLEEVNQYRSTDKELGLLQNVIERRERGDDDLLHNHKGALLATCAYCGMTELQTGSPFVIGQSRPEYDAYIDLYGSAPRVDDVISNDQHDTLVKFSVLLRDIPTPRAEMPKFPLLGTSLASKFLNTTKKQEASRPADICGLPISLSDEPCPVVHELCALNMFRNRVRRQRHSMRRCRRKIAERVIQICGINVEPLGFDDNGFSYWKFPMSDDLFICVNGFTDPPDWKLNLSVLLGRSKKSSKGSKSSSMMRVPNAHSGIGSSPVLSYAHITGGARWVRISNTSVLVRLVYNCLSDDNPVLSSLRRKIASVFLTPERMTSLNTIELSTSGHAERNLNDNNIDAPDDVVLDDDENGRVDATSGKGDSSGDEMEVEEEEGSEDNKREPRGKATKLLVQKKKGYDVPKRSIISQESIFDESDLLDVHDVNNGGEEDMSYLQYFSFAKSRFYAVALVDDWGSRIKTENLKKGIQVVYQVHREGMSQPLAHTPLNGPWGDDGIFYFACLSFKRSGHYIVTFLVEGPGYADIKPLVYHIRVEARHLLQGAPNAWNRLNARNFAQSHERQVVWNRRELNSVMYDLHDELSSVRSVLLTIYAALPNGALVMGPDSEDTQVDELNGVAEPAGWNKSLDRHWRSSVFQATTAHELMECTLLLEFYIPRQWLYGSTATNKAPLLAALPAPHYAMRNCTLSAVALRLYCLDRVLLYDKIQNVKRGSRLIGGDVKHVPNTLSHSARSSGTKSRPAPVTPVPPPSLGRQSRNSGGRGIPAAAEVDGGRIHRAAYTTANNRIANGFGHVDSSDDSDDGSGRRRGRREKRAPKADDWGFSSRTAPSQTPWACLFCRYENLPKSRSCSACGERKPSAALMETSKTTSRRERMKKRGVYESDSDTEFTKRRDENDSDNSSAQSTEHSSASKRRRNLKDDEEDVPVRKKRVTKQKQDEYEFDYEKIDFDDLFSSVMSQKFEECRATNDEVISGVATGKMNMYNSDVKHEVIASDETLTSECAGCPDHVVGKTSGINSGESGLSVRNTISVLDHKLGAGTIERHLHLGDIKVKNVVNISARSLGKEGEVVDIVEEGGVKANDVGTFVEERMDMSSSDVATDASNGVCYGTSRSDVKDTTLRMLSILRRIQSDESSGVFWFPVPLDIYTDYCERIKEPMDLGTITKQVVSGSHYGSDHKRFARDVGLVWANCRTYNLEGSEISLLAERLENFFNDLYEMWILNKELRPADPNIL